MKSPLHPTLQSALASLSRSGLIRNTSAMFSYPYTLLSQSEKGASCVFKDLALFQKGGVSYCLIFSNFHTLAAKWGGLCNQPAGGALASRRKSFRTRTYRKRLR